ncbi:serine hydrolase [Porphyrobacter sp. SLTP]|uniref:serine hydrolase domain-containing protein n=1 Tax=Porphyrobacter sp. SLTP TaxID=2683266 RepID=UPI001412B8F5|nr:serine hydrolase domain-containing protein [Porphyrobacter sp. SLTP]NBB23919.1 serine hydrolase [Porphyrobacter sp. SLTP]
MIRPLAALLALSLPVAAVAEEFPIDQVGAVINAAKFEGDIVISSGLDDLEIGGPRFSWTGLLPEPDRGWPDGLTWRWASVTKQVIAILVMREVERGTIDLDQPVATYLPAFRSANAGTATVRNLLQHRAGLPNPADVPEFYSAEFKGSRDPLNGFCAGPVTGAPGGDWAYNNCDYMVLGAVLEAVAGLSWDKLFIRDIAGPLGFEFAGAYPGEQFTRWGVIDGVREQPSDLSAYGASAGLYGEPDDILAIDNALMRGDLLGPEALAEMWKGDPALGYMALGQWVFEVPLKGCAEPVRIVERRGDVGAVQVRNFILPDKQMAVVAFSQEKPFDFGEVWQGSGFSHDLLAAAACPQGTP